MLNDGFAGAFTIADNGYMGLMSLSLLCFNDENGPWEHTESVITAMPMSKLKLPETSASGNTSAATENVLFYDGKAHKLDDVTFNLPANDYCKSWTFTSSDGRFKMDFRPVIDRAFLTDAKILVSDQHQVFGRMSEKAIWDDGQVIELKDVMCFAEKVHNKY